MKPQFRSLPNRHWPEDRVAMRTAGECLYGCCGSVGLKQYSRLELWSHLPGDDLAKFTCLVGRQIDRKLTMRIVPDWLFNWLVAYVRSGLPCLRYPYLNEPSSFWSWWRFIAQPRFLRTGETCEIARQAALVAEETWLRASI